MNFWISVLFRASSPVGIVFPVILLGRKCFANNLGTTLSLIGTLFNGIVMFKKRRGSIHFGKMNKTLHIIG